MNRPDDNLPIRHHHGDVTEVDLQILGELLSARVTGVHRQEDAELGVHFHLKMQQTSTPSCVHHIEAHTWRTRKQKWMKGTTLISNLVSVGEYELWLAFLLALQHHRDLLRGHRKHGQLDPVELVEATPRAGLSETLETKQRK